MSWSCIPRLTVEQADGELRPIDNVPEADPPKFHHFMTMCAISIDFVPKVIEGVFAASGIKLELSNLECWMVPHMGLDDLPYALKACPLSARGAELQSS